MSQYPSPTVIVANTKSIALSLLHLLVRISGHALQHLMGRTRDDRSAPLFFLTMGHDAFLVWPISMIWGGAWAAHSYNQRLLRRAGL